QALIPVGAFHTLAPRPSPVTRDTTRVHGRARGWSGLFCAGNVEGEGPLPAVAGPAARSGTHRGGTAWHTLERRPRPGSSNSRWSGSVPPWDTMHRSW